MSEKPQNVKIKSYDLYEQNKHLYMGLCFTYDNIDGTHELHLPKIKLGIDTGVLPNLETEAFTMNPDSYVNFGAHKLQLLRTNIDVTDKFGDTHHINCQYADALIKENQVEMTIEEIEKKLGHKIKIVGEK